MGLKDLINNAHKSKATKEIDPIGIFNLSNRQPGYAYLRANQEEFLNKWNDRRGDRDIVGVLNTGAGKTLIGLLMSKSKMIETGLPAIYLCPTQQLVNQVKKQAKYYGIEVCTVDDDWENDFHNADKILVTTFHKVFNGKSVFGVKGYSNSFPSIGSIVIDDAHACIKYARQQSTITINNDENYFKLLLELFTDDLRYQSEGKYNSIIRGEHSVCLELPYWTWRDNITKIKDILSDMSESNNEHVFQYRIISDYLETCRCYISGTKIEITPRNIPVSQIPSFSDAKYRYVLSATLNNEDLCSELKIDVNAIINPIFTTKSMTDVGERLIINPTKYHKDLTDEHIRYWLSHSTKKSNLNTIIIVPTLSYAEKWERHGAIVLNSDTIIDELESLREAKGKTIVLVNRYDGIDIPEDLSHILVLDGLPIFSTNREKIIQADTSNYNWYASQVAQRIEQGLGRTVRSVTDYSVVFLLGKGLADFVGRNEYLQYFSPALREQLQISKSLLTTTKYVTVKNALEEIIDSVNLCLRRDRKWIDYSKQQLSQAKSIEVAKDSIIKFAKERDVFELLDNGKFKEAESLLNQLKSAEKEKDTRIIAKYNQLLAEIYYYSDLETSNNLQIKAFETGSWENAFKPKSREIRRRLKGNQSQINASYEIIKGFSSKFDFSSYVDGILRNLVYDNNQDSNDFENAIEELGKLLGFVSKRPETLWNDGGPDNLWVTENTAIIIECKNRRTQERIVKGDIEQVLASRLWFENTVHSNYSGCYTVVLHRSSRVAHDAPLPDFYSIPSTKLENLKNNINKFKDLIFNLEIENVDQDKLNGILHQTNLEVSRLIESYFTPLTK